VIYDSRAIELKEWLAERDALVAEGWELVLPHQIKSGESPIYIRKPRPDLKYKAPVARYT
jgi:hypothetical protein